MKKIELFNLMSIVVCSCSCSKTLPPSNRTASQFDPGVYTWPLPPGLIDTGLTSNKTFKMKVLEYGTKTPVSGALLKFGSCNAPGIFCSKVTYFDSLVADNNGELLITSRDVSQYKCNLSKNNYWTHGSLEVVSMNLREQTERIDFIYRMGSVDSIVTYMYPRAWIKIYFLGNSLYASRSYLRPYLHMFGNNKQTTYELAIFRPKRKP